MVLLQIQIQRYFDSLPEEKVPKIGSNGERYRDTQLAYQLPKQDLSLSYCKHVESQNQASYEDFVSARNEIALDIGLYSDFLYGCVVVSNKSINPFHRIHQGCVAIIRLCSVRRTHQSGWIGRGCLEISRSGKCPPNCSRVSHQVKTYLKLSRCQMIWHPRCFQCSTCSELLVDLTYCVHDDKIFCERHYAEMLKPRCNACDEVSYIFTHKFISETWNFY